MTNKTFSLPADSGMTEKAGDAPPYPMELGNDPPPPTKPRTTWRGAQIRDKSIWLKCDCGPFRLKLNPIVTISSVLIIIAFILWCVLAKDRELLIIDF